MGLAMKTPVQSFIRTQLLAAALLGLAFGPVEASAQEVRIADLTYAERSTPVRLVGYGLVVGLDGTGDRATGSYGARHTVQSVANLLRNFDIEVPAEMLRTRNVAAVLVTAEVSPFLRPGGRFDIHVASLGDALSLRGGVLWMTPLVSEPGGPAAASAQGPIVLSEGSGTRATYTVETAGRIPEGGLLQAEMPRPAFAATSRLILREPEIATATRIAQTINQEFGAGAARVEDPGAVALAAPGGGDSLAEFLVGVGELRVSPTRGSRILIDGRDGTVVAGGDLRVGEAVVSHAGMTLTIGASELAPDLPGGVQMAPGASVQDVAAALHAIGATAPEIASIFESLRRIGALSAEVVSR
jgi:flagellar P-ring protein precursor FlgI